MGRAGTAALTIVNLVANVGLHKCLGVKASDTLSLIPEFPNSLDNPEHRPEAGNDELCDLKQL